MAGGKQDIREDINALKDLLHLSPGLDSQNVLIDLQKTQHLGLSKYRGTAYSSFFMCFFQMLTYLQVILQTFMDPL